MLQCAAQSAVLSQDCLPVAAAALKAQKAHGRRDRSAPCCIVHAMNIVHPHLGMHAMACALHDNSNTAVESAKPVLRSSAN